MILGNDAKTCARCIQQHTVERTRKDLRQFLTILACHDCIGDSQSVDVKLQGFESFLFQIVGEDTSCIFHKLGDVGRLASGSSSHIQNSFSHLRIESDDRQQGRCTLQHVVTCKILRRCSDGHSRLVYLDTDLAPFGKRIQIDSSLNETLCQFFSSCFKRVGSDSERSLGLVGLEELNQFCRVEEVEEMIDKFEVVAVVLMQEVSELFDIVFSGPALAKFGDVHEDGDGLLNLEAYNTDINGLFVLFGFDTALILQGLILPFLLCSFLTLDILKFSIVNLFIFSTFLFLRCKVIIIFLSILAILIELLLFFFVDFFLTGGVVAQRVKSIFLILILIDDFEEMFA